MLLSKIHIDAHSDMAPPSNLDELKNFQTKNIKLERDFLPMMQTNDAFLYSAILEGLVNRVIWVKPDWLKDNSTRQFKGYVGVTKMAGFKGDVMCYCDKIVDSGRAVGSHTCFREDPAREADRTEITFNQCKGLKTYSYIEISEGNFLEDIQLKKTLSVFIDIDEDFFGVESGVENFLLHGISIKTQKILDTILPQLYAPETFKEEMALDKKISELFFKLTEILMFKTSSSDASLRQKVRHVVTSQTGSFFRSSDALSEFVIFLSALSSVEADNLSKVRYCLLQSHRLVSDKRYTQFSVCHGNIYPGDRFVQDFFVGSAKEVEMRAGNLRNILQHIHKSTRPRFYTVARSLRDGYVPRDQQSFIERNIMQSIDRCERGIGRFRRTVYDPFLSFGKMGWTPVGNSNTVK